MTLFDVVASLVAAATVYFCFLFRFPRRGPVHLPAPSSPPASRTGAPGEDAR